MDYWDSRDCEHLFGPYGCHNEGIIEQEDIQFHDMHILVQVANHMVLVQLHQFEYLFLKRNVGTLVSKGIDNYGCDLYFWKGHLHNCKLGRLV